ncbi:UDP-glucose:glycoprotein glucosyltransferase 1-like [Convolutriloba macropyga]|uniref:UDP-glucose:glycoprotein glucosyltransferase 1-like n=1 Tax=Convolutriloba macropyga TaxID=536237 RepID=UPI003F5277E3
MRDFLVSSGSCSHVNKKVLSWILSILIVALAQFVDLALATPVTVSMTSRWSETPLLLETAQFLSRDRSQRDSFWHFVQSTVAKDFANFTDQDTYNWIVENTQFLDERVKESLKFSLSVRFDSPAIAMYQQMSKNYLESEKCEAFAVIKEKVTCDYKSVQQLVKEMKSLQSVSTPVFDFDHVFTSKLSEEETPLNVILYANLGTPSFKDFHEILKKLSNDGEIKYYLRFFERYSSKQLVHLSGFGVELAIKSTEYKAIDSSKDSDESSQLEALEDHAVIKGFDFNKLKKANPDLKENLNQFQFHLIQEAEGLKPLKVWELSDLSYQTVQKLKENEDPYEALSALKDYSQNFPIYANEFSKIKVSRALRDDVTSLQRVLENVVNEGSGFMLLNGLQIDIETLDPFSLVDVLYSESKLITSLFNFGLPFEYIRHLLNLNIGVQGEDEYAVDIRNDAINYVNDIERDDRYKKWPKSMQYLLQPTFPGSLRRLGRNIHHTVFIINPADVASKPYVVTAQYLLTNSVPSRIGFVFIRDENDEMNVLLNRIVGYFFYENVPKDSLVFLKSVYAAIQAGETINEDLLKQKFEEKFSNYLNFEAIIADEAYDKYSVFGSEYYAKSGLGDLPVVLYNGKPIKVSHVDNLDELIISDIYSGTFFWQKVVWEGDVDDDTDLLDFAMEQSHVMPRLNERVLNKDLSRYLEYARYRENTPFPSMNHAQMTEFISTQILYIAKKNPEFDKGVTLWVAASLEEPKGRALAYQALKYLKKSDSMRIGFLFNHKGKDSLISDAILATLLSQNNQDAKLFITKLVKEEFVEELKSGARSLKDLEITGMDSKAFHAAFEDKKKLNEIYAIHSEFSKEVLKAEATDQMLIANGKVIGPFKGNEEFGYDDFGLVDKYIHVLSSKEITKALKLMTKLNLVGNELSDLTMKITSTLLKNAADSERVEMPKGIFRDRLGVIHVPARKPDEPHHQIHVAVDPLSRAAQKVSTILEQIYKVVNVEISVVMNCVRKWSEMPLNSFYRYVLPTSLEFDQNGFISNSKLEAKFTGLPKATLLTMNLQTPESWLVEAVRTPYDLDNILLKDLDVETVHVNYELAHILLEGHCYEKQSGQPPRGLQFTLGTSREPQLYDTIVMANLGYFQLKANPGSWFLELRDGPSKEIYDIATTKGTSTPAGSEDVIVSMRSFTNKFIHIFVSKKPGMQDKDVLGQVESDKPQKTGGIWDTVKSSLFGDNGSAGSESAKASCPEGEDCTNDREAEVLNIFSVASGHLYERFMRVMMVSVLKNTKAPVKFWFLKNYLSPSFKDTVDAMKQHYDFEYELVEYKWPRWLNQQTEKQRMIWGYKILFLDVLFPLNIKKIIFVDADQVVRADLTELRDMDLDGAPYGYTPFCDDKKEMEGFRFWKSGYWAGHLAGRKYHISALYVIDLQKFRKIAAGDRLRGQYQGLSQDPNSLANLDQDLPNNMIHQVRIKSLPIEWLWCETWCSDESLSRAKTIDLCNNPLTKEPKLDRAMRIVPEWKEYDSEIRQILSQSMSSGNRNSGKSSDSSRNRGSSQTGKVEL